MRGGRERASRVRDDSSTRSGLHKLGRMIVNAGPILSLAGVVMLAGGLVVWVTVNELRNAALALVCLAVVMLLTATATHLSSVRSAVMARTGRYAANTSVMVAALTAILLLVGFISSENRYRLDLTATRQYTLAPQTEKVLSGMEERVEATIYSSPDDFRQERIKRRADDFFFEFNRRNRKFTYEFVDPDLEPSRARLDHVKEYPTIVFKSQDSERNPYLLTPLYFGEDFVLSEQDLVSSILIATGEQQKVVYFTTGHREKDSEDADEGSDGYGMARRGLLGDNYMVRTVNLTQVESIPSDAAVLIVAGPTGSFMVDEREKLERYLRNGGRAIFLLDEAYRTQLNKTINKWGVDMPEGTIVDVVSSVSSDPRSPIVRRGDYNPDSPITEPLDDTFFTGASAIQDVIIRAPEGLPPNPDEINITLTPLAITSMFSCVTTERDLSNCSGEDDLYGPHAIAMAIEAVAPVGEEAPAVGLGEEVQKTSMVIFGDSDFASNKYYFALSNSDLFLNSVDWLAQKYDLISIRSKPEAFRELVIDQKEFDFIRYSSWFLLPTGIMLLAGIAWWRRR